MGFVPADDSGTVVPGIVWLLLFGAAVFLLIAVAVVWASSQVALP